MNENIQQCIEELKKRDDVFGAILFGSWARGNNRPDSDVDLVVILNEGYRRTVEYKNGQAFEIIYTTEKGAFEFWKNNKDDAAGFWEVAKVLFDKDGTVRRLENETREMIQAGKELVDKYQLDQLRFDAEDQIKYAENIVGADPTTANFILTNKIFNLTKVFFDVRQMWTPAPKQRLAKIEEINPKFNSLLQQFYQEDEGTGERMTTAKKMIPIVFDRKTDTEG